LLLYAALKRRSSTVEEGDVVRDEGFLGGRGKQVPLSGFAGLK
jgi:hypothetical protein